MQNLTWINVLLIVGIASAFGGLLQGLYRRIYRLLDDENVDHHDGEIGRLARLPWWDLLIASFLGVGGGAAVLLVLSATNNLNLNDGDKNLIFLVVLGIVAGFIGYRILPRVARGLEERISKTEERSDTAILEAAQAANRAGIAAKAAHKAFVFALTAAASIKSEFEKCEGYLRELLEQEPDDRQVNLKLGSMVKRLGRYAEAGDIMSDFMRRNEELGQQGSLDWSDALYNRACYRIQDALKDDTRDENMLALGLNDLKNAISNFDILKDDAWMDSDFGVLKSEKNPTYYSLVGRSPSSG